MKAAIISVLVAVLVTAKWPDLLEFLGLSDLVLAESNSDSHNNKSNPPNVVIFMVDDLGYNQVGYHARETGNTEVKTPHIDAHATTGVRMNRAYTTPWCGPTRAALQTGRFNSFNSNVSNSVFSFSFDDDIGFSGGLQSHLTDYGTSTIAKAFSSQGYTTSYLGKWGISGSTWGNTPMGSGYDQFLGFLGDSIESCDGNRAWTASPADFRPNSGGILANILPGYWQQSKYTTNHLCPYFQSISNETLTQKEKDIACQTAPRTPSKLIDHELMEESARIIQEHDYSKPLFHMHATQLMHLPMQYPRHYDDDEENKGDEPAHFGNGKVKPPAENDDLRLTTRNSLRFVDDVFGTVMQSIKDAGQWDNTIVLFTSDNGGAIYINTANNNYPLRGMKFAPFEGGLRVPQFLTGGWIDKHTPRSRRTLSDTYTYMLDWAPTLLEMAGFDSVTLMLGGRKGAMYGNPMWNYIKESLALKASTEKPIQKVRKVTYSPVLMMDVQENATFKKYYTGDDGVVTPRHWSPNYPQNDEMIPDLGYVSIHPCRPNGKAQTCCVFDIENDPREFDPLEVNCDEMKEEASLLFYDPVSCEETPSLCIESLPPKINPPEDMTLWSHYGAAGPFTNKRGQPIGKELGMKCICDSIAPDIKLGDVTHFVAKLFAPSECIADPDATEGTHMMGSATIKCEGGFVRTPLAGVDKAFESTGVSKESYDAVANALSLPSLNAMMHEYATREGHTEFPFVSKVPFIGPFDTCAVKGVTNVPLPLRSLTPWISNSPFGSITSPNYAKKNLCLDWSKEWSWCPSFQNPKQNQISSWNYSISEPSATFLDGSVWTAMASQDCDRLCPKEGHGTAYIIKDDGKNWGLAV